MPYYFNFKFILLQVKWIFHMFNGHLNFFCELWFFPLYFFYWEVTVLNHYYLQCPLMPLLLFQTWVLQTMDVCLLKFMGLITTLTKQGTREQTATKITQNLKTWWMYLLQTHRKWEVPITATLLPLWWIYIARKRVPFSKRVYVHLLENWNSPLHL